jgi:hypothetical protein
VVSRAAASITVHGHCNRTRGENLWTTSCRATGAGTLALGARGSKLRSALACAADRPRAMTSLFRHERAPSTFRPHALARRAACPKSAGVLQGRRRFFSPFINYQGTGPLGARRSGLSDTSTSGDLQRRTPGVSTNPPLRHYQNRLRTPVTTADSFERAGFAVLSVEAAADAPLAGLSSGFPAFAPLQRLDGGGKTWRSARRVGLPCASGSEPDCGTKGHRPARQAHSLSRPARYNRAWMPTRSRR